MSEVDVQRVIEWEKLEAFCPFNAADAACRQVFVEPKSEEILMVAQAVKIEVIDGEAARVNIQIGESGAVNGVGRQARRPLRYPFDECRFAGAQLAE
jgi:hypothetical protein